jgi:hypothetical protein
MVGSDENNIILQQVGESSSDARFVISAPLAEAAEDSAVEIVRILSSGCRSHSLRGSGTSRQHAQRLRRRCQEWTEACLDSADLRRLQALPEGTRLRIQVPCQFVDMPWELLTCGHRYLCEHFATGRVIRDTPWTDANAPTAAFAAAPLIVLSDSWELTGTSLEETVVQRRLRQLQHQQAAGPAKVLSPVRGPELDQLIELLAETGWFHFAGHGVSGPDGRSLLLSEHDSPGSGKPRMLRAEDLVNLQQGPEVVVLDACGAAAVNHARTGEQLLQTLTGQFLRLGAAALVAPIVPLLDGQLRHFFRPLYEAIVKPCSIADALRYARVEARGQLEPDNLLPLSFVCYGEPDYEPGTCVDDSPRGTMTGPVARAEDRIPPAASLVRCTVCGRGIATRHGIDNTVSEGDDVRCRRCGTAAATAPGESRIQQPTGGARDLPLQPSLHSGDGGSAPGERMCAAADSHVADQPAVASAATSPPDSAAPAELAVGNSASESAERPAGPEFSQPLDRWSAVRIRIGQRLEQPICWKDLSSGEFVETRFIPCDVDLTECTRLADLDRRRDRGAVQPLFRGVLQDRHGAERAGLQVIPVPDESPASMTSASLASLLAQVHPVGTRHQHVFLISATGFAEALQQQLAAREVPDWYLAMGVTSSIYLYNCQNGQTASRETDAATFGLQGVLQQETEEQQYGRTVSWLRLQLPFTTSYSEREIMQELKVSSSAARTALRRVATEVNLRVDETDAWGLVISVPLPGEFADDGKEAMANRKRSARSGWSRWIRGVTGGSDSD